jgi:hypothetical protein
MEYNEMIVVLAKTNTTEYNLIKSCEELTELQEVLLKRFTKGGGPKRPSSESIIEEIGDVQIRLDILKQLFGEKAVEDRIKYKSEKFISHLEAKRYIGSI